MDLVSTDSTLNSQSLDVCRHGASCSRGSRMMHQSFCLVRDVGTALIVCAFISLMGAIEIWCNMQYRQSVQLKVCKNGTSPIPFTQFVSMQAQRASELPNSADGRIYKHKPVKLATSNSYWYRPMFDHAISQRWLVVGILAQSPGDIPFWDAGTVASPQ